MGEAKRRGTFEERKSMASKKQRLFKTSSTTSGLERKVGFIAAFSAILSSILRK